MNMFPVVRYPRAVGSLLSCLFALALHASPQVVTNNVPWTDTKNEQIRALGGSILQVGGTYYWYGYDFNYSTGQEAVYYTSTDLAHWTPGTATGLTDHGRPKVIYNQSTNQYVAITEGVGTRGGRNSLAFWTSTTPTGPFTKVRTQLIIPECTNMGDHGVWQDDDGTAYVIAVCDDGGAVTNGTLKIIRLTPDYLSQDAVVATFYYSYDYDKREAPGMFKRGSTYYLFASLTNGWSSSATEYFSATNVAGPWSARATVRTNPSGSTDSFDTQCNMVITLSPGIAGTSGGPNPGTTSFIYGGDRWPQAHSGSNTGQSEWYPLTFDANGVPTLNGYSTWNIDSATGTWSTQTPIPDFSLTASPGSRTIPAGAAATYTVSVGTQNGFNRTVSFSASGFPTGVTAAFAPSTVSTSGNTTLSLSAASTTQAGTYTVFVTATDGALTHVTPVTLMVDNWQPDFALSASPSSNTITAGQNTTYAAQVTPVNGYTGTTQLAVSGVPAGASATVGPNAVSGAGNTTVTVSTSTVTAAGTYPLTIKGTSGSLVHSSNVTLIVNGSPDFALYTSPPQTVYAGTSTGINATITSYNGFTSVASFSVAGLPNGVSGAFTPSSSTGSTILPLSTTTATGPGTYTLAVTATSGALQHTVSVPLVVYAPPPASSVFTSDSDIGSVGAAGSASYSNGVYTVLSTGTDISAQNDSFNYDSLAVSGDCAITARVFTQKVTTGWAKAGVTIRESTAPGAPFVQLVITPSHGLFMQCRRATGINVADLANITGLTVIAPYWLRLVRSGTTFTGSISSDGLHWTTVGSVNDVTMSSQATAGLAVTSNDASKQGKATFDFITVAP